MAAGNVPIAQNSPPLQSLQPPAGDANIAGFMPAPLAKLVTSITLGSGAELRSGQLLIADVMTYGGATPTIEAPSGWQLVRDDISPTTRQSLYAHVAESDDQPSAWKFSQPVDAQGVLLMLDNTSTSDPIDASSGIAGSQAVMAPALATTDDGDLILVLFATDFGFNDPGPSIPPNMIGIVNQDTDTHAYWILGSYQAQRGDLPEADCPTPQLYNAAAAQVAVRRR